MLGDHLSQIPCCGHNVCVSSNFQSWNPNLAQLDVMVSGGDEVTSVEPSGKGLAPLGKRCQRAPAPQEDPGPGRTQQQTVICELRSSRAGSWTRWGPGGPLPASGLAHLEATPPVVF